MAIPEIKYDNKGPYFGVRIKNSDSSSISESVWVGYIQTFKVFQYIGRICLTQTCLICFTKTISTFKSSNIFKGQ